MSFEEIDLQWFASAEDEGRTEEPSEAKIRRAREEGRLAKSQELNSSLVMLFTILTLVILAPFYLKWFEQILIFFFSRVNESSFLQRKYYFTFLSYFARFVLPLCIIGIIAAFASNLVQNKGFLFTTKPIEPNFSKITPKIGQYLKKTIFSFEGLFNVIKSLLKVVLVAFSAYLIIRRNVPVILSFLNASNVYRAVGKIASAGGTILIVCSILFVIISIPDYLMQRYQFMQSMKMTKQEFKQEYKEMEGDPETKAKLQQAQKDLLQRNIPKAVKESDVVITNPTHYAVALAYDREKDTAPRVNAKGTDNLALRIRQMAKENDVPIVENRALARTLYSKLEVDDIIPSDFFNAISVIYAQIGYMNKKK